MNAFLMLTSGGTPILVNYFNALSFKRVGTKTLVLMAPGCFHEVDQSLEEIQAMITEKAVWAK